MFTGVMQRVTEQQDLNVEATQPNIRASQLAQANEWAETFVV